ncbi:hypothetical protein [Geomonas ferrireducens]|uniref:hypothetical protein n=1 Tax=Geomonas ferrireducens TaxID=2570227 RepID=UPI0010A94993|nr:hypothetical protein [Geomonas ferrireducens]
MEKTLKEGEMLFKLAVSAFCLKNNQVAANDVPNIVPMISMTYPKVAEWRWKIVSSFFCAGVVPVSGMVLSLLKQAAG